LKYNNPKSAIQIYGDLKQGANDLFVSQDPFEGFKATDRCIIM